jgi:hypothetical protein
MLVPVRTWLETPEGKALRFSLLAEVVVILSDTLIELVKFLQQDPEHRTFSAETAATILSIQWDLIFLGLGTLVGSYLSAPRRRRNTEHLLHPFLWVTISLFAIAIIYAIWPLIGGLLWQRVVLTDVIGLGMIIYCVVKAAKVTR